MNSASVNSPNDGEGGINTGISPQRINSASSYDSDGNYGQLYTVPQKRKKNGTNKNDTFGENLGDNVAADGVVMDDIIDHMATPMGDEMDELLDDDGDHTPTIEMEHVHTNYDKNNGENDMADFILVL